MRGRNYNGLRGLSSHASLMMTIIRNNLRRKTRKKFKTPYKPSAYTHGEIEKKASPELLNEIREKTRMGTRNDLLKTRILLGFIALTFFLILWLS